MLATINTFGDRVPQASQELSKAVFSARGTVGGRCRAKVIQPQIIYILVEVEIQKSYNNNVKDGDFAHDTEAARLVLSENVAS